MGVFRTNSRGSSRQLRDTRSLLASSFHRRRSSICPPSQEWRTVPSRVPTQHQSAGGATSAQLRPKKTSKCLTLAEGGNVKTTSSSFPCLIKCVMPCTIYRDLRKKKK